MRHHCIGVIQERRSLGRRTYPITTSLRIARAFFHPVSAYRTQSKRRPRHTGAVRSKHWLCWIYGCARLSFAHVGIGTRNVLARETWKTRQIVVESIQPHGTIVCRQRPLSHNDWSKFSLHVSNCAFGSAGILKVSKPTVWVSPCLVDVSIKSTLRTVLKF